MIIRRRNKDLKVSRAQREEKVLIVLEWLCEFRASNAPILARRLGVTLSNCHKLLADMQAGGLVLPFENIHTRGLRLFALGRVGIQRLEAWGQDSSSAVVKTHNLSRRTTIMHDLCVQRLGLDLMEQYQCSELLWDLNIKTDSRMRPDLLLVKPDGNQAALEFDRTPKDQAHFFERLSANYESIIAGHYHAAIVATDSEATLERYQALFESSEWPIIRKNDSGALVRLTSTITPHPNIKARIHWLAAKDILSDVLSSRLRPDRASPKPALKALELGAR